MQRAVILTTKDIETGDLVSVHVDSVTNDNHAILYELDQVYYEVSKEAFVDAIPNPKFVKMENPKVDKEALAIIKEVKDTAVKTGQIIKK